MRENISVTRRPLQTFCVVKYFLNCRMICDSSSIKTIFTSFDNPVKKFLETQVKKPYSDSIFMPFKLLSIFILFLFYAINEILCDFYYFCREQSV